ncbi:hypothetical protein E3U55_07095 [Filobacillus milosensis]|uniref:DUF4871 domain-containing protein n=1 Tax=Filobacillus milosensis TaxID=94137 RepID=A0A4Y8INH0_9BACI|nr:hypothetical protein [Filobacillus milosensis]TFB22060.1 hypothetical protein E3U55_07095 [Filobacillus milosensis]
MKKFLCVLFLLIVVACDSQSTESNNHTDSSFEVNNQTLHGEEGKFGIIKVNGEENEPEFIAGTVGRLYYLYFWGNEDGMIGKEYRMEATHQETGETKILYEDMIQRPFSETNIDADAASGAKFAFNTEDAGWWTIDIFIDDEPFSSFMIEAKTLES